MPPHLSYSFMSVRSHKHLVRLNVVGKLWKLISTGYLYLPFSSELSRSRRTKIRDDRVIRELAKSKSANRPYGGTTATPRWQMKRLSRMQMEIYGGWNRFSRGITSAFIRRKERRAREIERESERERIGEWGREKSAWGERGNTREYNSRKNLIPKQLVIRRSANNRFVLATDTQSRCVCICICSCTYMKCTYMCAPHLAIVTSIQFPGDIIT